MSEARSKSESWAPMDHEHYFELCALATSGTLTDQEWGELQGHLTRCADCRKQMQEYREIARTGMALLMPEEKADEQAPAQACWSPEIARQELFGRLARGEGVPQHGLRSRADLPSTDAKWWTQLFRPEPPSVLRYAIAIVLVVALALSAYRIGAIRGEEVAGARATTTTTDSNLRVQLNQVMLERAALDGQLKARTADLQSVAEALQRQIGEVEKWRTLQNQAAETGQLQASTISVLQSERDAIDRKLRESEAVLQTVQEQYDTLRRQRSAELLRTASLENRIEQLSARLGESEATVRQQEQFLSSDRDIRELMGARKLYIADVFDVDAIGRTEKPFGRIFYTQGKSLIFYAFDLDRQRGVRNASIFQAWGRRGFEDKRPLNMGIFYLDSETNKRWVLKFDDPKALAQIDAVFVTLEPRGGSQKPSGKQLLFASLRSTPNHP